MYEGEWEKIKSDKSTQTEAKNISDVLSEINFSLKTSLDLILHLLEASAVLGNPRCS
jgi:hypothetical protein